MDSRFTVARTLVQETSEKPPTCLTTSVLETLNVPTFLIDQCFDEVSQIGSKNGSQNVIISVYGNSRVQ